MEDVLKKTRKLFKDNSIDYVECKYKYELEIPESALKSIPSEFEFTSKRNGYQRFRTSEIKDLVYKLETVEEKEQQQLTNFVCFLFKQFHENFRTWDAFVSILAELDCLCSLSLVSFFSNGIMCRPQVVDAKPAANAFIELKEARHPCLCLVGVNFIPNDVCLGSEKVTEFNQSLMLLTGPNMGGKSTALRMVCVIAIIA